MSVSQGVKVEEVGDSAFLIDEAVDRFRFMNENNRLMEFYRKIKIPDEVIEGLGETGMEGEYTAEYLVEPEHIREGVAEV